MSVSPARRCAYTVVRRTFEDGAYADRVLTAEATGLGARDRAFATALAYTVIQRRATLDHVLARLSSRPPARLDAGVLAALRLGLAQLLLLDGVADHAAVHESVELAKADSRGAGGFANAVLRRASREGRGLVGALDDATPEGAAVLHSVPAWLARQWFSELGADEARALLASVNRPAESALRANPLVAGAPEVAAELAGLRVPSHPAPGLPEGLVLEAPFDAHGSALWDRGAIMPQSRASMLPAHVLAPRPGERVLDLCAAPGAKAGQLAAMLEGRGSLVAVERHPRRAAALERNLARLRVRGAQVRVADATALPDEAAFDRVLVDPPCSGLGTLQSRPDLRWRVTPEAVRALPAVQGAILRAGARALAPGGTLVYSVCTISRAEGEEVVARFLDEMPGYSAAPAVAGEGTGRTGADGYLRTLPHRDGTDGFFVARLRRDGGPTTTG
jgi:16S rRNA (cytosine967-C5)-methyltransferase